MSRSKLLFAGVLGVFMAAAGARHGIAAGEPATGLDALSWMVGSWAGEQGKMQMEELWTAAKGGAMLGLHRDIVGGRMVSFEFLRIEASAGGIVYQASPKGAPATPFRMIESAATRVVFENREHDFPQRILYWLGEDGSLHARIEGPQGGKTVSQEWRWQRAGGGSK